MFKRLKIFRLLFLRSLWNYSCRSSKWRLDDQREREKIAKENGTRVRREKIEKYSIFVQIIVWTQHNKSFLKLLPMFTYPKNTLSSEQNTVPLKECRTHDKDQKKNIRNVHWNENNVYIGKIRKDACHHLEHIKYFFCGRFKRVNIRRFTDKYTSTHSDSMRWRTFNEKSQTNKHKKQNRFFISLFNFFVYSFRNRA